MMKGYIPLILATTLFLLYCTTATPEGWIRGVSPAEQKLFKVAVFACRREPTRKIPISHVNDNYCDCNDGSDEPGTSACKAGFFYCVNKGHQGERIFSSRVNDGICDCCDGSDEYDGKTCPNTCDELGAKVRKQKEEEMRKYQEGLKVKATWISEAQQGLQNKRDEIEKWKQQVEGMKKVVTDLEAEKAAMEEKEKVERQAIADQQELEGQQKEKEELERLQNLSPGTEPEEKSADTKPVEKAADTKPVETPSQDTTEGAQAPEETADIADEQAEVEKQEEATETEELKAILEDKKKIDGELTAARNDVSATDRKIKENEELLAYDFGPQSEFFALHGECFDFKSREYTYTVCPFDTVKQSHTSLGKFEKWDPAYSVMKFTNGQQCWGGPKRSAAVTFLCSETNEVIDVSEPSKCEYAMKFRTPAACSSAHLEMLALETEGHEEDNYF